MTDQSIEDASRKPFFEWYEANELRFAHAQMSEKEIAESAWQAARQSSQSEPVAWKLIGTDGKRSAVTDSIENVAEAIKLNSVGREINVIPLYAAPQQAIPSGWKLVPIEPTKEMVIAGFAKMLEVGKRETAEHYRAMIAASPTAPIESDK
jgi:uncharacterized protein YbdZ (MbtH family)